jgi:hypothetical protein
VVTINISYMCCLRDVIRRSRSLIGGAYTWGDWWWIVMLIRSISSIHNGMDPYDSKHKLLQVMLMYAG